MWKSREVSLHRLFILFFIYSFSHTTWTQHSVFSMNSPASPHIPQSCSVQLHCFYVRDQLSSCGAAVRARVPAARDRSSSGPLGVSLVGLGHHFKPPWSTGDGDFFYLFFSNDCKNVTLLCFPFFFIFYFLPPCSVDRGDDLIFFFLLLSSRSSSVLLSAEYTWIGVRRRFTVLFFFGAIICPGENRPTPSKLTVGIPGIVLILFHELRIRVTFSIRCVNNGDVLKYCYYCCELH